MIWGWQDCSVVRSTWCGSLTGGVCSPAPVVGAGGGGGGGGWERGGGAPESSLDSTGAPGTREPTLTQ